MVLREGVCTMSMMFVQVVLYLQKVPVLKKIKFGYGIDDWVMSLLGT